MNQTQFNQGLMDFIKASPTPFHAVAVMSAQLEAAGFQYLSLEQIWKLERGQRYYTTRNGSSIVAFVYGNAPVAEAGIRMLGAHTDSPCLKVKPSPEIVQEGYFQLGVEVYGGVLLNPWFDRDLSLAGRVTYQSDNGLSSCLLDFGRAIATIPSLAIHLDREVNSKRSINPQNDITPVVAIAAEQSDLHFRDLLLAELKAQKPELAIDKVLDFELSFYDVQAPALVGLQQEFIASARLDNLASCYLGLQAILQADGEQSVLLACNDHEEVGSESAAGASGPMVSDVLSRWIPDHQERSRAIQCSMLISADNAHGVHPNYNDRHDPNHRPRLNGGPVIKVNANQRYATNSETSAVFQRACAESQVEPQYFVSRNDMPCGSTIGPLTATALGVATVDVGLPTFAMHSIRELAGTSDAFDFYRAVLSFQKLATVKV